MTQTQGNESVFTIQSGRGLETTLVELNPEFKVQDWQGLETIYRAKVKVGFINWDLDIRKLDFINSLFLGLIVGFNAMLNSRGGNLSLTIHKNSKIASLLHLAKLDRVMTIHER